LGRKGAKYDYEIERARNKTLFMKSTITFVSAVVADTDYVYLAATLDESERDDHFTRLFQFDEYRKEVWSHHDVERRVINVGLYAIPPKFDYFGICSLSDEGDVEFNTESGPVVEKIPGAGVFSEGATGWGYMSHLRQIGEHLYACGDGGQVYRRHGPDDWRHVDTGLLQTPPITDRLQLNCINGLTEDDIYLAGDFPGPAGLEGRLFHFDGAAWHQLAIPPVGYLNAIHIESAERVWICGENGPLLLGNARDGFRNLSRIEDNQLFYSLTLFGGLLYLASNLGLFSYDPTHPDAGIREVVTGLTPELQDAHIVDACDGVLWSIGFKDIARFDGTRWERIHHLDNPRIGA
jgi:hypothetical protein